MKTFLRTTTLFISLAVTVLAISNYSIAQTKSTTKKSATTGAGKTISKTDGAQLALVSNDDDSMIPINAGVTKEYKCELNDSLTIYTHNDDDSRVALRWKNKLYGLKRVATTTGANRFENKKSGLVWIGIPTKGMLLDSIRGQQLANECKTAGQ